MSRKSRARKLLTVDCETDPFLYGRVPLPFIWDVYDIEAKKHFTFRHTSDCLHFLVRQHAVCYAHNGGKFDYLMPGFLNELKAGDSILVINGRLAKFKMGECEFRDSINILPIALAEYQKEVIDYKKFERNVREKHIEEITAYLHKDTEYLAEIVSKFREEYGDGITLAGSALKFWKNRFNAEVPRSNKAFYDRISPYYYGGRCECFHVGMVEGEFGMADINSAYPYAMLHEHPISTVDHHVKPKKNDPIIPQSFYRLDATSKGAFPLREHGGGLRFPIGRDIYCVSGWELLAGIDTGTVNVHEIHERIDFSETCNFKTYINHFYEMKKASEKNSPAYIFSKLFMNSLYGKMAADPSEYKNYTLCEPDSVFLCEKCGTTYENGECPDCGFCGGNFAGDLGKLSILATDLPEEQQHYYNVATGASITGFVRAFLWRKICAIRKKGGIVLYADTDSIAYQGDGGFQFDSELGGWGDECKKHGRFVKGGIAGKKLYAFRHADGEDKISCKGVDLTANQVWDICNGKTVEYLRDAPSLSHSRRITGVEEMDRKKLFVSRKTQLTGKVER